MYTIAHVSLTFVGGHISTKSFAQRVKLALAGELAFPLFIFALAAFVYGLYGFDGVLLRAYSIYLYSRQRMAEGVPPYAFIFGMGWVALANPKAGLLNLALGEGTLDIYGAAGIAFVLGVCGLPLVVL